jgi:hypothetical protein
MSNRVGGIIFVKVDGVQLQAKGSFTYNLGIPKREMVVGADTIHGHKEMPKPAFIEGLITDQDDLDLATLQSITNAEVTLELANGKIVGFSEAVYTADGDGTTEEGEIQVRFDSARQGQETTV